jgi:hypothetical protein
MDGVSAADIVEQSNKLKRLIKTTLGSGSGKELLDELKEIYCNGKIFCNNERDTCYFLGQRDLILELEASVKDAIPTELQNGER